MMCMPLPEADRLVQAATGALGNGQMVQAAGLLDEALRVDPRHTMALTKQAEVALYRRDAERALGLTGAALAIEPNFAPAWHQHAWACWQSGRPEDAVRAARRAVEIQPPNPDFRLRLAQFTAWTGQGDDTRTALAPLLAGQQHDPSHYAAALSMLGELAIAEGRFDEAQAYLDQALELRPALQVTRMLHGMNLLRLGRLREGWPGYALREGLRARYPDDPPSLAPQPWRGEALAGKTLVVTDDQGHGDAIQFFRYLPLLRDRGARVTWRTFPPLERLLRAAAPYATVVSTLPTDARFDFQCNSTSLPQWFGTELDSIPSGVPYLSPRARPEPAQPGRRALKIGLVWSGDPRHARDHLRSVPAATFLELANVAGPRYFSLQHVVRTTDLPALESHRAIGREVERAADFADAAALIARLDLVITVDTAIAHLAGAMGKPVWIVLHVAADWRWFTERTDSPWYPSARLFRVTAAEWLDGPGWAPVLGRVATALRALADG